jgi:hypothetical protein
MKKKKSEVDATKQTLAQADQGVLEPNHPTPKVVTPTTVTLYHDHETGEILGTATLSPVTDGVIDLDPETKTDIEQHVGRAAHVREISECRRS